MVYQFVRYYHVHHRNSDLHRFTASPMFRHTHITACCFFLRLSLIIHIIIHCAMCSGYAGRTASNSVTYPPNHAKSYLEKNIICIYNHLYIYIFFFSLLAQCSKICCGHAQILSRDRSHRIIRAYTCPLGCHNHIKSLPSESGTDLNVRIHFVVMERRKKTAG